MTVFNPNHPDVKKKVEKYIASTLNLPVKFVIALPVKESGRSNSWKVELENDEKRSFIILKTPKADVENSSPAPEKYDFFRQYRLLKQLETTKLKAPKVSGLDEKGTALGTPCFLEESLKGRVLYNFLKLKEKWAGELYIKSVIEIQNIKKEELGETAKELGEGAKTKDNFSNIIKELAKQQKGPLVSRVIGKLTDNQPAGIKNCFGNGDFNPKNFLAKDELLTGILDFEFAGFFDPLLEFLLPFERYPLLKNRGLEEDYCGRMGFENKNIDWYRGLILTGRLLQALKTGDDNPENEGRNIKEETLAELSKWAGK